MLERVDTLDRPEAPWPSEKPGALLRALRGRRGWTLSDVSRRTGIQVSTLSKLENGKLSFTYDKLVQIATGLGIDVGELLSPGAAALPVRFAGRRSITRRDEGVPLSAATYAYKHLAVDLLNKQLMPMVGEVRARSLDEFGEMVAHPGEEFVYVLEGTLELHTSLYAPVRLEEGDSAYFDADMKHAYVSAGSKICRILSVCSVRQGPPGSLETSNGSKASDL